MTQCHLPPGLCHQQPRERINLQHCEHNWGSTTRECKPTCCWSSKTGCPEGNKGYTWTRYPITLPVAGIHVNLSELWLCSLIRRSQGPMIFSAAKEDKKGLLFGPRWHWCWMREGLPLGESEYSVQRKNLVLDLIHKFLPSSALSFFNLSFLGSKRTIRTHRHHLWTWTSASFGRDLDLYWDLFICSSHLRKDENYTQDYAITVHHDKPIMKIPRCRTTAPKYCYSPVEKTVRTSASGITES